MRRPTVPNLESVLGSRLRDARRVAVVGIGDELSRHDRLGILAARDLEALHLPGVKVFLAGTLPESFTGPIRRWKPDHVILLDAADLEARPGVVAVIGAQEIRGSRLSTHAIPLSLMIGYLEKDVGIRVTLVGIQPDLRAQGPAATAPETSGVTHLVASLHRLLAPGGHRAAARSRSTARASKRGRPPSRSKMISARKGSSERRSRGRSRHDRG